MTYSQKLIPTTYHSTYTYHIYYVYLLYLRHGIFLSLIIVHMVFYRI